MNNFCNTYMNTLEPSVQQLIKNGTKNFVKKAQNIKYLKYAKNRFFDTFLA